MRRWSMTDADESSSSSSATASSTGNTVAVHDQPSDGNDLTLQRTTINTMDPTSEQEFLQQCKLLCAERNIPFTKIKNARDLASVQNSPVLPGRIYRMGRISDATAPDIERLFETLHIQTLVDLRSPTELKDDPTLMRTEVFADFTNIVWQERRSNLQKKDCLRVLPEGQGPVQYKDDAKVPKIPFWQRRSSSSSSSTATMATDGATTTNPSDLVNNETPAVASSSTTVVLPLDDMIINTYDNVDEDDNVLIVNGNDDDEECGLECMDDSDMLLQQQQQRERYFVSLMNEFKYVKGTVSKLRKRDITATIIKSPGAMFSRRVRAHIKQPFLKEINDGGLPMLNELLFKFGAPGIRYVLQLCSDPTKHPIAFYCTAGKDRTGAIAAIILSLCHTNIDDIVEDYTLSANVYAEMNDHQAMVGALSQRNLDPKTFLGAPSTVMYQTIQFLQKEYGSVEDYCTAIGFPPSQQEQLRNACMK
jgi:hypothetical protein